MNMVDLPTSSQSTTAQSPSSYGCCRLTRRVLPAAVCAVLIVVYAAGWWMGGGSSENPLTLAPLSIDATASASSEDFSVATGSVGKSAEGFFMLDHDTGLLQCHVLYPRVGKFGASFATNVKDILPGGGKGGGYLMVTGFADFPGGSNQPLAPGAVVYVMDTSTGAYACYAVPFDRVAETAMRPQQNALVLIGKGEARQVIERDTLR